jgi:hypothetical protein
MAKGREFEEFVTRVEAVLVPEGADVKHNDCVPDRITGKLRQVDTTVRFEIGDLPVLVTIESRDRAKDEDSMWIEQLVTKRNDIGAFKTIAVSSSAFPSQQSLKPDITASKSGSCHLSATMISKIGFTTFN